jgi:hypothetical protein
MVQPSHFWDFPDYPKLRPLDQPRHRTIHGQRPVRTPVMIILEVLGQEPPQMALMQDDDMVQAFSTDTPDEPLHVWILPQTPGSDQYFFDPYVPYPLPKSSAVDPVPIAQEIAWRFFPRNASTTCWAVHSAVGCFVTLKWTTRRRL